ncbi:hypothetical protein MAJ_02392, partial [Metarhizium majus ARSEF 297]
MRAATPTEDSGMAESTFELISSTDVEYHDENYTESISESVGSLDFHRPDDVQSLAGTEQTFDDESLADEEVEISPQSAEHEAGTEFINDETVVAQQVSDASESDEEARSRCSLSYTQQSLKTPSILTPEASKIIERPPENKNNKFYTTPVRFRHWMDIAREGMFRTWEYASDATSAVLPGLFFGVVFSLLISTLYPSTVEFMKPAETVVTSTVTATTTPLVIYTKQSTSTATVAQHTTSTKGMGLIAIKEEASDEWLFGLKRPDVQFSPLGHGAVVVHIASHVQKTWLKKNNCVLITATRNGEAVEVEFYPSKDGFLVKFPKKEAFGVVKLLVEATCRPTVTKAVKVHFGKGIMEEAYERTMNLAHDISELVPVAAQEAERCIVGAKKSFGAVSDTVASGMVTVSDTLIGRLKASSARMERLISKLPSSSVEYAREVVDRVPQTLESMYKQASEAMGSHSNIQLDIQDGILDAELYFLRTRISAKMWWLKVTRQTAEHDEYGKKAQDFVAKRRCEGRNKIRGLLRDDGKDHGFCGRTKRSWCKRHSRKGRDGTFIFTR